MYPAKIDKEIVRNLPLAHTDCEIEVIDSPEEVKRAVEYLCLSDVVGFDTETKPTFQKGKLNKIALLQLSTEKKCFLFRLQMIGKNEILRKFLENECIKKIGLATRDDFYRLNAWNKVNPKNFIDLQKFVNQFGIAEMSLQRIYAIIFGKKISKRQQLSNWEAKMLDKAQQIYAATDAWACREIYLKLLSDNKLHI